MHPSRGRTRPHLVQRLLVKLRLGHISQPFEPAAGEAGVSAQHFLSKGLGEYLESLVARIDAPQLEVYSIKSHLRLHNSFDLSIAHQC